MQHLGPHPGPTESEPHGHKVPGDSIGKASIMLFRGSVTILPDTVREYLESS